MSKYFAPFFTTKEPGKGTGLGLWVSFIMIDGIGGNRTKATRLLEISHPSLLSKIKAYQIDA